VPFRAATEDEINPVPVRVSVCEGEPARILGGEMEAMVGAGLSAGVTEGDPAELPPLQPASKKE
jgi:hypothetical protein